VRHGIGNAGGDIGAVDLVESGRDRIIATSPSNAARQRARHADRQPLKHCASASSHLRPHLPHAPRRQDEVQSKYRCGRATTSDGYTPGWRASSLGHQGGPQRAFSLTIKQNTWPSSPTHGRARLGDIGPEAACRHGRQAMLFKSSPTSTLPVCLATKEPDKIVET